MEPQCTLSIEEIKRKIAEYVFMRDKNEEYNIRQRYTGNRKGNLNFYMRDGIRYDRERLK